MSFLKVKNRAYSTLASGVDDDDTEWTLATGEGARFPTTGNFHVTCEDEIVKCTARSNDVLTVTRAQEDTSAAAHASGKAVELRITAGVIENCQEELTTHKDLTTGVHGITLAYLGESSVQALNLASHKSRHAWLGVDEVGIKDNFLAKMSPFWLKNWMDATGFTQANSGTGSQTLGWIFLILATGTTSGSKASVYAATSIWMAYASANFKIRFSLRINFQTAVTNQTLWFGLFETPATPTDTQKHIGFKIIGADLYATNADGTTQTITDTGIDIAQYGVYDLYFQDFGDGIYFYVNGVLKATHTTNRPTGISTFPLLYIINSATEAKTILAYPLMVHQGTE